MRLRLVAVVAAFLLGLPATSSAAPPAPFAVLSPAEGARVTSRTPTLTWERSSGTSGPLQYEVQLDGNKPVGVVNDADCAASCSFTVPTPWSSSLHYFQIVAKDAGGSTSSALRTLTVDVPPKILQFFVYPAWSFKGAQPPASVIHGPSCPQAYVKSDDPDATVSADMEGINLRYASDAISWIAAGKCNLAAGPHTVVATVRDMLGNTATDSLVFRTDLAVAAARIDGPAHVVKGQTATYRVVADPSTVVTPLTFKWTNWACAGYCPSLGYGQEIRVPITNDVYELQVDVKDAEGDFTDPTLHVVAGPKPPQGSAGVKTPAYSSHRRVNLRLVWPAGATQATVTSRGKAQTFDVARAIPWKLDGSGLATVRVKFDWPLPAKSYVAHVLVDPRRPRVLRAFAFRGTLSLRAQDNSSGVVKVQLASRRSHPAMARAYRSTLRTRAANWVRVIDRAGNRSAWHRILHG
jgi:hypothetical protein